MNASAAEQFFLKTIESASRLQIDSLPLGDGHGLLLFTAESSRLRRQQLLLQARHCFEEQAPPAADMAASQGNFADSPDCQVTAEEKNQLFAFLHQNSPD